MVAKLCAPSVVLNPPDEEIAKLFSKTDFEKL
jgi:hypothetical protein